MGKRINAPHIEERAPSATPGPGPIQRGPRRVTIRYASGATNQEYTMCWILDVEDAHQLANALANMNGWKWWMLTVERID